MVYHEYEHTAREGHEEHSHIEDMTLTSSDMKARSGSLTIGERVPS